MLRNWSETLGGRLVSGTEYVGLLGSEILAAASAGDLGASIFANDSIDPSKRYRAKIVANTVPGLWLYEDGSGEASGAGVCTVEIYEDNLLIGTSKITVGWAYFTDLGAPVLVVRKNADGRYIVAGEATNTGLQAVIGVSSAGQLMVLE